MTRTNEHRRRVAALTLACGLGLAGCTVRVADLTLISTKNIDLSNARLDARQGQRVKADDCIYSILGLIPLGVPNLENAVDRALEKGGGNIMVDQVTYQSGYYFVLLGMNCILVEGTVLRAPSTAS